MSNESASSTVIEVGCVLAMIISWSVNKSILWAIIHCMFSWFYVIYFAGFR